MGGPRPWGTPFLQSPFGLTGSRAVIFLGGLGVLVNQLFHEICIWNSMCLRFSFGKDCPGPRGGSVCVPPAPRPTRIPCCAP